MLYNGFPWWLSCKNLPANVFQCRRCRIDPYIEKIPCRRKWQPTLEFLPGKCHGKRSLLGYSPWGLRIGHDLATKQQHCYITLVFSERSCLLRSAMIVMSIESVLNEKTNL